ncbi:hypothetical protein ACWDYH_39665 [Nocardia goodfellowii]
MAADQRAVLVEQAGLRAMAELRLPADENPARLLSLSPWRAVQLSSFAGMGRR